jgi:tetratricopeptide (TPR) repeat protein
MSVATNRLWTSFPVLRRLAILATIAALVVMTAWAIVRPYFLDAPAGDYQVRQGDILLSDGDYDAAIERFDAAIALSPEHRGAWMGKAIAYMQSDRPAQAEAAFAHLIDGVGQSLAPDDRTGRAVLAGAYANRGILNDRQGRYEEALADYRHALAIDAGAVEGPGTFHKILYGNAHASTVRLRADYLARQLALPARDRLLRVPEIDAQQRMYKP